MSLELEEQYDKIYRYCYFKVRDRDTAEDLTQETFLRYFSQSPAIRRGKPLAYLYTIAKHQCIDHYRKTPALPLEEEYPVPDGLAPLETSLSLRAALKALPSEDQELLLLRFSNELAVGELAQWMGVSRFAVRRRLNAALKMLRRQLREEDFYG